MKKENIISEKQNKETKAKKYRESMQSKDYSAPDPACLTRHKEIMRGMKPHSEWPGNDR